MRVSHTSTRTIFQIQLADSPHPGAFEGLKVFLKKGDFEDTIGFYLFFASMQKIYKIRLHPQN